jgi:hypothetical protein
VNGGCVEIGAALAEDGRQPCGNVGPVSWPVIAIRLWHKDRDAVTYSYGVLRDSVIAIP